jgi:hypothetical protein
MILSSNLNTILSSNLNMILSNNLSMIPLPRTTCMAHFLEAQSQCLLSSIISSNMTTDPRHLCLLSSLNTITKTPSNRTHASFHKHSPLLTLSKLMRDSHATPWHTVSKPSALAARPTPVTDLSLAHDLSLVAVTP